MLNNFDKIKKDLLDNLSDGIRLDIFDKINGICTENNTEYKIYDIEDIKTEFIEKFPINVPENSEIKIHVNNLQSQVIEKLKVSRTLNKDEHYVHFVNHYRWIMNDGGNCHNINVIMVLGTLTNFSNLTWLQIKSQLGTNAITEQKNYDLNTPLHNMYINILTTIKSLSPQSLNGCYRSPQYHGSASKSVYVQNIHK